jgi:hypothetical protein
METQSKTITNNEKGMCLRFTADQAWSFLKILKLVHSHVQVTYFDGSHYMVMGEEPHRRYEPLSTVDVVFIEKMRDKLSDLMEVLP